MNHAPPSSRTSLDELFLGDRAAALPRAAGLLHEALLEHARWRHERYPVGADAAARDPALIATRDALRDLDEDLRRSVPYFSPRYVGHMAAEPLLPATLAKMVAALYNQNNVADDSAPATAEREREVIAALVRMLGMGDEREHAPWGHLTSGGSVANYEGLWHLRAARFHSVALAAALTSDLPASVIEAARALLDRSPWERVNLTMDEVFDLRVDLFAAAAREGATVVGKLAAAVERHRPEHVGLVPFHAAHGIAPAVVLLPETAHYSWVKAANLLGLGAGQLVRVPTDARMRMRPDALAERVAELGRARVPIVATIAVAGCTQFGAVDPIDRILAVRDEARTIGSDFGLHVDAAWGGFITTLLRDGNGRRRECGALERETIVALRALADVDSITVDPHKQGFVPFGAGAYIARRGELAALDASDAAYVFGRDAACDAPTAMSRDLGRYSLEGSRSGESAAACSVAYRVMPLHADGLGRLVAASLRSARRFVALVEALDPVVTGVHLRPFVRPETNLVCLAAVPSGSSLCHREPRARRSSLRVTNGLTRALAERLRHTPDRPGEGGFIASTTVVELTTLEPAACRALLANLGLAAEPDDDHVFLLRHTLMNPLLDVTHEGVDPLADYVRHLGALCAALGFASPPPPLHEDDLHAAS